MSTKKPLIERMYALVCQQPGYTADEYLTALKANLRSGGCLTSLEYANYVRFEIGNDNQKRWFPVPLVAGTQVFKVYNPNHPYFVAQREKAKMSSLPEMKYFTEYGKTKDLIAKQSHFSQEERLELHNQLENEGYAHVLLWKEYGYRDFSVGAKFCLEECKTIQNKIADMNRQKNHIEDVGGEDADE